MRVVFAGTPQFAADILQALLETSHEVVCVYTQPDRPAGRGRKLRQSPTKELARARNLAVRQPAGLKSNAEREQLAALEADLMIVAAYGLLLPPSILDTPARGCINVHASLLPRWRGAAPIQHAILAGDRKTGVSIMQMDAGLDTGCILHAASCEIRDDDTADSLGRRLASLGASTLISVLERIELDGIEAVPQNESDASYAPLIHKREARLDWSLEAEVLARRVRAFNPWPIAYTEFDENGDAPVSRLRIWAATVRDEDVGDMEPGTVLRAGAGGIDVATGKGTLSLQFVQRPGARVMSTGEFLNARSVPPGTRLGGH
jgi:methionyl-tRNA formyltransferase